jgi:hypothetical protein
MDKIKLFLFASLMLVSGFEKVSFAQCTANSTPMSDDFGTPVGGTCSGAQTAIDVYVVNQCNNCIGSQAINDGEYALACDGTNFNSGWFGGLGTTVADHTGGGNFLLVNPGAGPREFYHRTVSNLCPGTTYNLTYYAGNITRESSTPGVCLYNNLPSLQAYIFPAGTAVSACGSVSTGGCVPAGGTLLGSTGDMGCPSQTTFIWNAYSYYFTTGASQTSADIVLVSLYGNNAGYDLAIDDIIVTDSAGVITAVNSVGNQNTTIHVFPNPSSEQINITFPEKYDKVELVLSDCTGRQISYKNYSEETEILMDISQHKAGIYFLKITTGSQTLNEKIIIAK